MSDKLKKEELKLLHEAGYASRVIELYGNMVNVGIMENPDVALAYTGLYGDTIKLYMKISSDKRIEDAKFQYLGYPASSACG